VTEAGEEIWNFSNRNIPLLNFGSIPYSARKPIAFAQEQA
jgi:hypothetical protein